MELEHEFTVPVDVSTAWDVLLDVERIAPCLPGATIESAGGGSGTGGEDAPETFTGRVKVRVGPITVAYVGVASFTEKDESARRAVLQARGRETRGAGTAAATVTATLHEAGDDTRVAVHTNLAITGRPAQFGRGVMDDVGAKLLGQFADCLAAELTSATSATSEPVQPRPASESSEEPNAEPTESPETTTPAGTRRPTPDSINLVGVAGGSVMRRIVLPVLLIVALIVTLIVLL